MPYQPPSAYPPAYPPPPVTKKRPSWGWFLAGGVLMLAGAVLSAVVLATFGIDVDRDDALFTASSGTHDVTVPAHVRRGIFVVESEPNPQCNVTHTDGSQIDLEPATSDYTYDEWMAVLVFDTGDGRLRFQCHGGADARIRIAMVPDRHDFVRIGILGVAVPAGLGGLGFLVVLITGILWYTRRPTSTYPPPPPGWQAPPPGWPPRT